MQDAPERTNEPGTCTPTSAKSVHGRYGFVPAGGLHKLRDKYGAESPIGHRCSNIEELLKQPNPPIMLLQRQVAELQALLAAR